MSDRPNIVVVHRALADGSSWGDVIEPMQSAGCTVRPPQRPLASTMFTGVMGEPIWKPLPTWYLVANDEVIPPDAERQFAKRMSATTVEIPSSHEAMVSHPAEVAELIDKAAEAVGATAAPNAARGASK
jgi:pimeloyl-ACP methyl ester carboxylesterase